MLTQLLSGASRGSDLLARGMGRVAGLGFLIVAVFIAAEVVSRNVFGISTQSTIELSGYVLAFGITWGLAGGLEARAHIRIDVFVQKVPPAIRGWLHALAMLALAVFSGFLAWGMVKLADESRIFGATDISALKVPLLLPQGLAAFGLCVFFLMVCLRFIRVVMLLPSGDIAAIEALTGPRSYVEEAQEALDALPKETSPKTDTIQSKAD